MERETVRERDGAMERKTERERERWVYAKTNREREREENDRGRDETDGQDEA